MSPDSEVRTRKNVSELLSHLQGRLVPLVVCISNSWGGLEQVAGNDALDLARLGIFVRVLCLKGSPLHEHLVHSGEKNIEIVPITYRPRNFFDLKLRSDLISQYDSGVNLVHCHQPSLLGSIVPSLWANPRVALIASRHILNNHSKRSLYHRLLFRRLDFFVVMSHALRRNILQTHGIRDRQVKVVNLGLDFEEFNPDLVSAEEQRKGWGADEDTTVVGLVGRIDPAKGQDTLIKAAAGLLKSPRAGEKLKFIVVGEQTLGANSGYLEELQKLVAQFHLEDHVIFAGYQENIPEVMRAFDIFVMPSRQETFGLVAIEAMAMECPIVISSGGSADEIVGEEEFGRLMRPQDPFDLQRQLRQLLDNPMERVQMGQRAREHVIANYDLKGRVRRTLALYERAIRRRQR